MNGGKQKTGDTDQVSVFMSIVKDRQENSLYTVDLIKRIQNTNKSKFCHSIS